MRFGRAPPFIFVITGLVPVIHAIFAGGIGSGVDGRNESGHDDKTTHLVRLHPDLKRTAVDLAEALTDGVKAMPLEHSRALVACYSPRSLKEG